MHPDVERLTRIVQPPERPVRVDVGAFEREVGAALPSDFADLMQAYGPGVFDEHVVAFAPDRAIRYDIFERTLDHREINEYLAQQIPGFHFPYPIYPDAGGLLLWGELGEGPLLWWLTEGDPDHWPVLVQEYKGESFFRYGGTAAALVADLIEEKVEIPFVAEGEPWTEHRFDPLANPHGR